ncbi:MAG TPA: diacylglycerol kinase family protein [Solirubrobacteraceae bacterium]|jgi:diacylglycerol kinase family enzyme|nr:diacylglycerol kinase family protein [Solirubrobacteraceae bacterium]
MSVVEPTVSVPAGDQIPALGEAPTDFEPDIPAVKRRMLIIVNPYATTVSDRLRHLVVYALQGGFEVDAVDTEARGHATELCREAAHEGYDVVVAFGGDGTVNEAANGLLGSPTPLTCLPGGSANVFAKMLGIPGELVDATEHLLALADDWRPRRVDLGVVSAGGPGDGREVADRRCFTFASGLGVDASVVQRVDANPRLKARLGAYYFTWVALRTFARRYLVKPPRMEVALTDGDTLAGVTTIVQNGSPFTYFQNRPIEIADGTTLDSGSLCGCVLHRATPLSMPSIGLRAFSRGARVTRHRQVTGLSELAELTVRSSDERRLPLQVDGDYLGEVSQVRYSIMPGALNVVA